VNNRGVHDLETLTAPELQRLIEGGVSTAVVPFGSIEHQAAHLPIGADALLADAVGREVARRLDAVLAPTVRVGCAQPHLEYMGTLSLCGETLTEVAVDIADSLARHGLRRIVFVSTHDGNHAALDAAVARLGDLACAPRGDVGPDPDDWLTSALLALRPDLVDPADAEPDAGAERGAQYIERYVASIVERAG
jgi:Creatinine amidohydrolase